MHGDAVPHSHAHGLTAATPFSTDGGPPCPTAAHDPAAKYVSTGPCRATRFPAVTTEDHSPEGNVRSAWPARTRQDSRVILAP